MKGILKSYALPIIHQTASEETLNDHNEAYPHIERAPGSWWDIKNISHFGLLFLCFNVSKHLRKLSADFPQDFELPLLAYVDEGLAKAGTSIDLPNWGDVIEGQRILFCDSKDNAGIQIADFAAFTISRTQWIIAQQKLGQKVSGGDLEFLKTTRNLNIVNLPMVEFSIDNLSREGFEFVLKRDRQAKGLSSRPRKGPRGN